MPMEDYIDARCPFCRFYLTDLDGMWECQEGCGAYSHPGTGKWITSDEPFQGNYGMQKDIELYNSEGKLIAGELLDYPELGQIFRNDY